MSITHNACGKFTEQTINRLKKNFLDYTTPLILDSRDGLPFWREKILLYFMYIIMLSAGIAYIPSIILSISEKLWSIALLDTTAYSITIYLFFSKHLSVRFRTIIILAVIYVLGIFLIMIVGPYGAGYLWLFVLPIIASILTDAKAALIVILINLITLIIIGFLKYNGTFITYDNIPFSISSWVIIIANFSFLELVVTFLITKLTRGLEKTLNNEKEISHSLAVRTNELKKAKEFADRANSLKSEFLAQMSHEIRSPINSILSSVSMMKENPHELNTEEKEELFAIIQRGSNRIIRTIDSILNMSEMHTGSYHANFESVFIINDILKPVIAEFKHIAQNKNISIELSNILGADYSLKVDRYAATQIFVNLIDNAVKYTDRGGVKILVDSRNENVKVIIIDTGIGISSEYLNNLFEPFSQEESGYSRRWDGNGLGLALVKKYCELNNAHVSVESEKGKGSRFQVIFPLSL